MRSGGGDKWDNLTEILEWSGFFEGAAIIHWALVVGLAQKINADDLRQLAHNGQEFHHTNLTMIGQMLEANGQNRA